MTTEQNMLDEIKDIKAKIDLAKAIAVSGNGFDTAILPKGTFVNIPEKIGDHKIFESPYVEDGKIIFVNSDKIDNYGY